MTKKIALALCVTGFFLIFVLQQRSSLGTPVCSGDCMGYVYKASPQEMKDAIAQNNAAPEGSPKRNYFEDRPFTIPLIFSLFGEFSDKSALAIVQAQSLVSFVAWVCLAFSIARQFKHPPIQVPVFFSILLCLFGRDMPHYNLYILSDSLSASFCVLFCSFCFLCLGPNSLIQKDSANYHKAFLFAVYAAITALAIFSRESNAAFIGPAALFFYFSAPRHLKITALVYFLAALSLCFASAVSSSGSSSELYTMQNVVAHRICKNPEAFAFFKSRGLSEESCAFLASDMDGPVSDYFPVGLSAFFNTDAARPEPAEDFYAQNPGIGKPIEREYHFSARQNFKIKESEKPAFSRKTYLLFLATHPQLPAKVLWNYREFILDSSPFPPSQGRFMYLPECKKPCLPHLDASSSWTRRLSLMDGLPLDVFACAGLGIFLLGIFEFKIKPASTRTGAPPLLALPLWGVGLLCSGAFCSTLCFLGDFWFISEMQRHVFMGSIFFKLGLFLIILFPLSIIDSNLMAQSLPAPDDTTS